MDAELWFSFIMLWFFCDPMFPQLFQEVFQREESAALRSTMLFYPLVCTVVFFLPVALGVFGLFLPGTRRKRSGPGSSLMMKEIGGDFMGTLIISAGWLR